MEISRGCCFKRVWVWGVKLEYAVPDKKHLNTSRTKIYNMKRKTKRTTKLKGAELDRAIKEAQKDPEFIKEVKRFIKATT